MTPNSISFSLDPYYRYILPPQFPSPAAATFDFLVVVVVFVIVVVVNIDSSPFISSVFSLCVVLSIQPSIGDQLSFCWSKSIGSRLSLDASWTDPTGNSRLQKYSSACLSLSIERTASTFFSHSAETKNYLLFLLFVSWLPGIWPVNNGFIDGRKSSYIYRAKRHDFSNK